MLSISKKIIITILTIIFIGCFDVHDNEITAQIDFCELIDSIRTEEYINNNNVDKIQEWGDCEYNEDCETNLCVCETCIDISNFIKFE